MSLFEFILVYAVCWWLVLLIVLPIGLRMPDAPEKGHAPSAPVNPRLKRKLLVTSFIALVPPLLFLSIQQARATDPSMFKTSAPSSARDCVEYAPDADVNASDDDATLGGSTHSFENVPTYLDAPASDYTTNQRISEDLRSGVVQLGVVSTNTRTGETHINGQRVGGTGCQ